MSKRHFGYRVAWDYWGFGIAFRRGTDAWGVEVEIGLGPLYLYWGIGP